MFTHAINWEDLSLFVVYEFTQADKICEISTRSITYLYITHEDEEEKAGMGEGVNDENSENTCRPDYFKLNYSQNAFSTIQEV